MPLQHCDRCQAHWNYEWKCQVVCPNCGARQDCSDLFVDHERVQEIRAHIQARRGITHDNT